MALVGKKAPFFSAPAVVNGDQIIQDFSLQNYIGKQAVVLFFYPKDFTFVCPTELYGLQQRMDEFAQRNVAIVGCSTDTEETHWAWLHVDPSQGGIKGVTYPLIADASKTISANFGVLGGEWYIDEHEQMQFEGTPVAYRGIFLIDKEGIIRHMLINDLPLGRSVDEILRTIDMWQHVKEHGEVCPINWQAGEMAFKPTTEDLLNYLTENIDDSSCDSYSCEEADACRPCGGKEKGECGQRCGTEKSGTQCNCNRENCKCAGECDTSEKCNQSDFEKDNCQGRCATYR